MTITDEALNSTAVVPPPARRTDRRPPVGPPEAPVGLARDPIAEYLANNPETTQAIKRDPIAEHLHSLGPVRPIEVQTQSGLDGETVRGDSVEFDAMPHPDFAAGRDAPVATDFEGFVEGGPGRNAAMAPVDDRAAITKFGESLRERPAPTEDQLNDAMKWTRRLGFIPFALDTVGLSGGKTDTAIKTGIAAGVSAATGGILKQPEVLTRAMEGALRKVERAQFEKAAKAAAADFDLPPVHLKPLPGAGTRVANDDGTFSSERTITVEFDGRHYIIPTLLGGEQKTEDEAIEAALARELQGYPSFDTAEEAEKAAGERSEQLGRQLPEAHKELTPEERLEMANDIHSVRPVDGPAPDQTAIGEAAEFLREASQEFRANSPAMEGIANLADFLAHDIPGYLGSAYPGNEEGFDWTYWVFHSGQAFGTLGVAAGAGAIAAAVPGGGPALAMAVGATVAGAMEAGLVFDDYTRLLMKQGYSEDEAKELAAGGAIAYGAAAGLVEVLPMGAIFSKAPMLRRAYVRAIVAANTEGGEEVIQELLDKTNRVFQNIDPKALEKMTAFELWQAFVLGAVAGGGAGVLAGAVHGDQKDAPELSPAEELFVSNVEMAEFLVEQTEAQRKAELPGPATSIELEPGQLNEDAGPHREQMRRVESEQAADLAEILEGRLPTAEELQNIDPAALDKGLIEGMDVSSLIDLAVTMGMTGTADTKTKESTGLFNLTVAELQAAVVDRLGGAVSTPVLEKPVSYAATPEGAAEFVDAHPTVAQTLAAKTTPSRADLVKAGFTQLQGKAPSLEVRGEGVSRGLRQHQGEEGRTTTGRQRTELATALRTALDQRAHMPEMRGGMRPATTGELLASRGQLQHNRASGRLAAMPEMLQTRHEGMLTRIDAELARRRVAVGDADPGERRPGPGVEDLGGTESSIALEIESRRAAVARLDRTTAIARFPDLGAGIADQHETARQDAEAVHQVEDQILVHLQRIEELEEQQAAIREARRVEAGPPFGPDEFEGASLAETVAEARAATDEFFRLRRAFEEGEPGADQALVDEARREAFRARLAVAFAGGPKMGEPLDVQEEAPFGPETAEREGDTDAVALRKKLAAEEGRPPAKAKSPAVVRKVEDAEEVDVDLDDMTLFRFPHQDPKEDAKNKKQVEAIAREAEKIDEAERKKAAAGPKGPGGKSTGRKALPPTPKEGKTVGAKIVGIGKAMPKKDKPHMRSEQFRGILIDGDVAVVTDGVRLFLMPLPKGHGLKSGMYLDGAGNDTKKGKLKKANGDPENFPAYPDYQKVIPKAPAAGLQGKHAPAELLRLIGIADAAALKVEDKHGKLVPVPVFIVQNPDGSIGMHTGSADAGVVAEVNVAPGHTVLGALNPLFLKDALRAHLIAGDTEIALSWADAKSPMMMKGPNLTTVTMPKNTDVEGKGKKPKPTSPGTTRPGVSAPVVPSAPVSNRPVKPKPKKKSKGKKETKREKDKREKAERTAAAVDHVAATGIEIKGKGQYGYDDKSEEAGDRAIEAAFPADVVGEMTDQAYTTLRNKVLSSARMKIREAARLAKEAAAKSKGPKAPRSKPIKLTAAQDNEFMAVFPSMHDRFDADGALGIAGKSRTLSLTLAELEELADAIRSTYGGTTGIEVHPATAKSMLKLADTLTHIAESMAKDASTDGFEQEQAELAAEKKKWEDEVRGQINTSGGMIDLPDGGAVIISKSTDENEAATPWRVTRFARENGKLVATGHTVHKTLDDPESGGAYPSGAVQEAANQLRHSKPKSKGKKKPERASIKLTAGQIREAITGESLIETLGDKFDQVAQSGNLDSLTDAELADVAEILRLKYGEGGLDDPSPQTNRTMLALADKIDHVLGKPAAPAKSKGKKADDAPLLVGQATSIMGHASVLAATETIDGVRYELYNDEKLRDTGGAVRIVDIESGEVVSITRFPKYDDAEAKYESTIEKVEAGAGKSKGKKGPKTPPLPRTTTEVQDETRRLLDGANSAPGLFTWRRPKGNAAKPKKPTTATEQAVADWVGDGRALPVVSGVLKYAKEVRAFGLPWQKALLNMLDRGAFRIVRVENTPAVRGSINGLGWDGAFLYWIEPVAEEAAAPQSKKKKGKKPKAVTPAETLETGETTREGSPEHLKDATDEVLAKSLIAERLRYVLSEAEERRITPGRKKDMERDAAALDGEIEELLQEIEVVYGAEAAAKVREQMEGDIVEDAGDAEASGDPFMPRPADPYTGDPGGITVGDRVTGRLSAPAGSVGTVNEPQILRQLGKVLEVAGRVTPIRVGRTGRYRGLHYSYQNIIRLMKANNIPTGVHEVGHALQLMIFDRVGTDADRAAGRSRLDDPTAQRGGTPWVVANGVTRLMQAELLALGKALYVDMVPNGGYKSEGFAEFLRLWVAPDPDGRTALSEAPLFHAWFKSEYLDKNPKVHKELLKARKMVETWGEMGSTARAKASILDPAAASERLRRTAHAVRAAATVRVLMDMADPLHQMAREAEKIIGHKFGEKGMKLRADIDPSFIFAALTKVHTARAEHMVQRSMIDIRGQPTSGSLDEALALVRHKLGTGRQFKALALSLFKGSEMDFVVYLHAKRTQALLGIATEPGHPRATKARDSGMSWQDAQQIIEEFGSVEFEMAAAKVYQWEDGVQQYLAQASPTYARIVRAIDNVDPGFYIPLQREFGLMDTEFAKMKRRTGGAIGSSFAAHLRGSGRRIKNPFQSMIEQTEFRILQAHQRMVIDAIVRLQARVPHMGQLMTEIPPSHPKVAQRSAEELVALIERKTRAPGEERRDVELVDEDGEAIDLEGEMIAFYGIAPPAPGETPIVPIWQSDGKIHYYEVRPDVYHALNGMQHFRFGHPAAELLFALPASTLRMGTTGLNASFSLIRNPARDVATLAFNTQTSSNPAQLFLHWAQQMGAGLLRAGTADTKRTPFMDLAIASGVEQANSLAQDMGHLGRITSRLFEGRAVRIIDPHNFWDGLRSLLQFPETVPRVVEFKLMAKEAGIKIEKGEDGKWRMPHITQAQSLQLLLGAKQVTTDFTSAGQFGQMWNRVVPFHNAAIQGPRANIRALMRNPKGGLKSGWAKFLGRGIELFGITMMLWWWNKDKEWYQQMSTRNKALFWFIEYGDDELIAIPRPFEVGQVFGAIPEALIDGWYQDDPDTLKVALGSAFDTSFPPVVPQAAKVILEQTGNRNFFWDTPILSRSDLDAFPSEQFNDYTSSAAIKLARLVRREDDEGVEELAGDLSEQILLGVFRSPKRFDHFIRTLFGGTGVGFLRAFGKGPAGEDDEFEMADIPVLGSVFQRGGRTGTRSQAIQDLYDAQERAVAIARTPPSGSTREPETSAQRRTRLMLTDATRAVTALNYVRRYTPEQADKRTISRDALQIAKDALHATDSGTARLVRPSIKKSSTDAKLRKDITTIGQLPDAVGAEKRAGLIQTHAAKASMPRVTKKQKGELVRDYRKRQAARKADIAAGVEALKKLGATAEEAELLLKTRFEGGTLRQRRLRVRKLLKAG